MPLLLLEEEDDAASIEEAFAEMERLAALREDISTHLEICRQCAAGERGLCREGARLVRAAFA